MKPEEIAKHLTEKMINMSKSRKEGSRSKVLEDKGADLKSQH